MEHANASIETIGSHKITMHIGGKEVGIMSPTFVIAEMSGNHNQSLERALEIVGAASSAGVHALKL